MPQGTTVTTTQRHDDEQQQRNRIMEFARNVALRTPSSSSPLHQPARPPPPQRAQKDEEEEEELIVLIEDDDDDDGGGEIARKRIMAHAASVEASQQQLLQKQQTDYHPINSTLRDLAAAREARQQRNFSTTTITPKTTPTPTTTENNKASVLKILSYNVWFREDVALQHRMSAISDIIDRTNPDVIALQEVTPFIYHILSRNAWWQARYIAFPSPTEVATGHASYFTTLLAKPSLIYNPPATASAATSSSNRTPTPPPRFHCIPFENSRMGRDLKTVTLKSAATRDHYLIVATAHLESPTGSSKARLFSEARVQQCRQSLGLLDEALGTPQQQLQGSIVCIGDMNWSESNDGAPPLPSDAWQDVWKEHKPMDAEGYTYDAVSNAMLNRGQKRPLRLRLDRAFAKLGGGCKVESIEMVGREVIPGARFEGRAVLPSDHYGLLLTLSF